MLFITFIFRSFLGGRNLLFPLVALIKQPISTRESRLLIQITSPTCFNRMDMYSAVGPKVERGFSFVVNLKVNNFFCILLSSVNWCHKNEGMNLHRMLSSGSNLKKKMIQKVWHTGNCKQTVLIDCIGANTEIYSAHLVNKIVDLTNKQRIKSMDASIQIYTTQAVQNYFADYAKCVLMNKCVPEWCRKMSIKY